jgi:hypothetical protein
MITFKEEVTFLQTGHLLKKNGKCIKQAMTSHMSLSGFQKSREQQAI